MKAPKVEDVKRGISVLWETLRCPICLDLMNNPVSTKCDHQFCKFCMTKLLDCTKRKEANCPICQTKVSKRSLQESPGFQRLVEGLQNLIKAFEHDSSTNYFTGICQQRKQMCVREAESKEYLSNGDKVSSIDTDLTGEKDGEQKDLPTSLTSTLADKDGFANLMGLEDSCPFVSDNEGFDSGLGEAPTADKEMVFKGLGSHAEGQEPAGDTSATHVVETSTSRPRSRGRKRITESTNPSCQLVLIPDVGENQNVRRSSRNRNKETSTPEKMIDSRQKKSLEKVSEWLLKNPPLEKNSEVENVSLASEDCASATGDFSTAAILPDNLEMREGGLKREERVKGIEEQVFGAVYKRERRGVLGFSPPNRAVKDSSESHLVVEAQITNSVPKRQMSRRLTPADVVKRPRCEEKHEGVFNDQPEEREKHDILHESENPHGKSDDLNQELDSSSADRLGNGLIEVPEEIIGEVEGQHEHVPALGVLRRHGKRTSRRKMSDTWKNVDGDLQAQAKTKLERSEKKNTAKEKREADMGKPVKVPKPLVLVGVGENDSNPIEIPNTGTKALETAVHIESYPSSEEIGSPNMRQTRRSKRLQHFTEEVQSSRKKPCTEKSMIFPVDTCAADTDHVLPSQSIKRNGCVYDEDMGEIENMDSKDTEMIMEKTNTVDVSGIPLEANCIGSEAMVSRSDSPKTNMPPLKAVDCNNSVIDQSNEEATASEARCVEMEKEEEDVNDSELDTEQLVKSFKAIKRKSFRLGSSTMKKSDQKSDSDEQNSTTSKKTSLMGSGGVEIDRDEKIHSTKDCIVVQKQLGARIELEHSCCSDLIPPSNSPPHIQQKATLSRQRGLMKSIGNRLSVEAEELSNQNANVVTQENLPSQHSGSGVSGILSPNKVAQSQLLNSHPLNSGPMFPLFGASEEYSLALGSPKQSTVNEKPHQLHCSWMKSLERSQNPKSATPVEQEKCPDYTNGNVTNSEVSLTPDGLLPQISQTEASQAVENAQGSSEASVHVPIKNNPKQRRRKARRLESSESDCSDEEDQLPSLAQIFRRSSDPPEDQACASVLKEPSSLSSGQVKDQKTPAKVDRVEVTHAAGRQAEPDDGPPAPGGSEWVNSSQASVDLFGTPDECEVAVNDTGLSMESSQFSSEIIATQQKIAMQEELKRLESMMALVSEALQEKESAPNPQLPPQADSLAGTNLHTNLPCGREICSRECAADREGEAASMPPGSGASEGLGPTQPGSTKHEGTSGMGRHCRQSQSGRSLRSIHANEIPAPVGSRVKPGEQTTHASGVPLSQSRDSKENREDAPSVDTRSTHRLQSDRLQSDRLQSDRLQSNRARAQMVLVPSGLGVNEQAMLKKFAKRVGGRVCSQVTAETTHVIMNTDEQMVCERTLKYFLGIAGRKWVVSFQWISECFTQEQLLREMPYEVRGDVVNGRDHQGPMRARVTGESNLLMKDYEICFQGPFTDMTTGQMEWMVELCGARVVKDPLLFIDKWKSHQVVIVQPGSDSSEVISYKALQRNATVVTRGWLLDTVATYTIQSFDNYKIPSPAPL